MISFISVGVEFLAAQALRKGSISKSSCNMSFEIFLSSFSNLKPRGSLSEGIGSRIKVPEPCHTSKAPLNNSLIVASRKLLRPTEKVFERVASFWRLS
ncbi:MAG: hypothetical protein JJE21_11070 [Spirochaetaceae bacterium]|nr:hypothetical protein [Spirochaetaceae bacterium]